MASLTTFTLSYFLVLAQASDQIYSNGTLSLTLSSLTKTLSVRPGSTVNLQFILMNQGEGGRFIISQQSRFGISGTLSQNSLYLDTGRQVTLAVKHILVGGQVGDRKDFGIKVERERRGRNRESPPNDGNNGGWNGGNNEGRPDWNNGGNQNGDHGGRPDGNNGGNNGGWNGGNQDGNHGGRPDGNNGGNNGGWNGGNQDGNHGGRPDGNNGGNQDGNHGGRPDGNNGGNNGGWNGGNQDGNHGGRPDGNNGGNNGGWNGGNQDGNHGGRPDGNNGGNNGGWNGGNQDGNHGGRPDGNNGGWNGGNQDGNHGGRPDGNNGGWNGENQDGNHGGRPDGNNNGWNGGNNNNDGWNGGNQNDDGNNGGWNEGRPDSRSSIEKMVEFHLSSQHEQDHEEPMAVTGYVESDECEDEDNCRRHHWTAPFSAEDSQSGLWSVKFSGEDVVWWHDPIMVGSRRSVTGGVRVSCCREEVVMEVKDVAGKVMRISVSREEYSGEVDIAMICGIIGGGVLVLAIVLIGGVCLCKRRYSTVSQNDA